MYEIIKWVLVGLVLVAIIATMVVPAVGTHNIFDSAPKARLVV